MSKKKEKSKFGPTGRGSQEFEKLGTHIATGDELDKRREAYKKLCDVLETGTVKAQTPEKTIEQIEAKFDQVVQIITTEGIPFGIGGTDEQFGRLTFLFRKLCGRVKSAFGIWKTLVEEKQQVTAEEFDRLHEGLMVTISKQGKKPDNAEVKKQLKAMITHSITTGNEDMNTRWDAVNKVKRVMETEIFSRIRAIADYCWREPDITKRKVIVIHQNVTGGGFRGVGLNTIEKPEEEY